MTDSTHDLLAEVRAARDLPSPEMARLIRRAAGVSVARMAQALEINRTTLFRWETGEMQPRAAQRARYGQLLAELQREVAS